MPRLTSFFQAVSLGMELGVAMKGKKTEKTAVKSSNKASTKTKKVMAIQKDRPKKVALKIRALMKKKGRATIADMHKAIASIVKGSADPKGYLNKLLHDNKEFERVPNERGVYRLKAAKATNGKAVTAPASN